MTELRLGQQRPTRMRRIGSGHMIVMPQQVARLLSVDDIERSLAVARQQEQVAQQQLDRARAFRVDLEQQLEAFRALPIVRVEDDPDVPQPGPPQETIGRALRRVPQPTEVAGAAAPVLTDS